MKYQLHIRIPSKVTEGKLRISSLFFKVQEVHLFQKSWDGNQIGTQIV